MSAAASDDLDPALLDAGLDVGFGRRDVRVDDGGGAEPGRFRVLGELGRGGMGIVMDAEDRVLGRSVALKLLRDAPADPARRRRFLNEARIAGGLEHPGIVPVHDVGHGADGEPYLVMRRVEGTTLRVRLAARGTPDSERYQLLRIFERLAQALAFAHARGIIHRDVKPDNVMLGAYGEVVLMDWGLAKDLEGNATEDTGRGEAALAASDVSTPGQVLGTPSFMAPEQARGETSVVDRRADVFSLGAVLCEILTGLGPWEAGSAEKIREQARGADLEPARTRLGACDADPDLVSLAIDCLSPRAEDRPADAGEVATRISLHLEAVEQRARRAEVEAAAARAAALHERRARRLGIAVAVAIVLALMAVAAALVLFERARRDRAAGLARVRDRELVERLDRIAGDYGFDRNEIRADRELSEAFRAHGMDPADAEAAARIRDSAIRERLLAALDDWFLMRPTRERGMHVDWRDLARIADAAGEDSRRAAVREAYLDGDVAALEAAARAARERPLPPQVARLLIAALAAAGRRGPALDVARANVARHPGDFEAHLALGLALGRASPPDLEGSVAHLTAAIACRPRHPNAWLNRAVARSRLGRVAEALADAEEARRLAPDRAVVRDLLASLLLDQRRLDEAETEAREAVRLEPGFVQAWVNLGSILAGAGRIDAASAAWEKAYSLGDSRGVAACKLANLARARGDLGLARSRAEEAVAADPTNATHRATLATIRYESGDLEGALDGMREAVRLGPERRDSRFALGQMLRSAGRFEEALASLEEARDRAGRLSTPVDAVLDAVRDCEEELALEREVDAVVAGATSVGADRLRRLVRHCRTFGRSVAEVRLLGRLREVEPAAASETRERLVILALDVARSGARGEPELRSEMGELVMRELTEDVRELRERLDAGSITSAAAAARLERWTDAKALAPFRPPRLTGPEQSRWTALWATMERLLDEL